MNVIRYQNPSKAWCLGLGENITQSIQKGLPVLIICKYFSSLNASCNDMLENPWSIESG